MKRVTGILAAVALALAACTTPEEPPSGDIAALEGEQKDEAREGGGGGARDDGGRGGNQESGTNKGAGKAATGGGRMAQPGGGGTSEEPADGGGSAGPAGTAPAAAAPIPEGTFDYATDGERSVSGNEEPMPETTTLTAAAPADGVQRQTRDLRDSEGNGILTESDLVYRGGGTALSYVKITARFQGGLTDVREFRLPRPEVIAPKGAGPGFARAFTMQGSGTRARVSIEALRYQDVTIAGRTVTALVVQNDIEFSGALEGHQRSTTWFWPKHLLPLREQVRTDVQNGPIRVQSNYVATIRRLP
ncbi:MAG: hypothetical protein ABR613_06395 [Actinomycetota bacterium]